MGTMMRSTGRLATTASLAVFAYAAMDMCHEVLGHGVATLFFDDITPVQLTTVALSSQGAVNRVVAVAGPLVNLVLGMVAMAWFRRLTTFGPGAFLLWLFATINLLNGTGYAVYSGVLDFGDLAVVTGGWEPHMAWRIGMAILGVAGYYLSLRLAAVSLARQRDADPIGRQAIHRLTWPAYLAGGVLLAAGAAMNPQPNLFLLVGVTGGFGCMLGLLFVPALTESAKAKATRVEPWQTSWGWIVGAVLTAVIFVFVVGPGVALHD